MRRRWLELCCRSSSKLPAEEALREVQRYLSGKVFDSPSLAEAAQEVVAEYRRTIRRCPLERALAEREARSACAKRAADLHRYMVQRLEFLRQECEHITGHLQALLRRVETEAAKLGWH